MTSMSLPYIATLEDKPDWLVQAEAADRYNLEASKRQDGDDDPECPHFAHPNISDAMALQIHFQEAHWRSVRGQPHPYDIPFQIPAERY